MFYFLFVGFKCWLSPFNPTHLFNHSFLQLQHAQRQMQWHRDGASEENVLFSVILLFSLYFLFWGFVFTLAPSLSLTENSNQNVKRKVFASPPFHLPEHTETHCVLCARLSVGSLVGEIRSCQRWSRCCSISSRQCSPTLLPTSSTCALETTRSSQRYGPFRHTHTHTQLMTVFPVKRKLYTSQQWPCSYGGGSAVECRVTNVAACYPGSESLFTSCSTSAI